MSRDCTVNSSFSSIEIIDTPVLLPSVTVSDEVIRIVTTISYGVVCQIINLFGMGTSIINIICFVKQGFKESVNISLLALAISDFGCLFTMIWSGLCGVPFFQELDLPFDPMDTQYLTTAMPHVVFTRITACITALITLERCLCVMLPLKVGQLLTPKRTASVTVGIYIVLILCATPVYMAASLAMRFSPKRNRTILAMVFTDKRDQMEQISFTINSIFVPFTAFLIIIVCMIIVVRALQKQAKWRKSCSSATSKDTMAVREQKLTKMVVMISVLFVSCFTPSVMIFITVLLVPEFSFDGKHENILLLTFTFSIILESTNSSMNIFVYYHMSSRYRAIFRQTFVEKPSCLKHG